MTRMIAMAMLLLAAVDSLRAEQPILDSEPCKPMADYGSLDKFGQYYFDAKTWNELRNDKSIACSHMHYESDGLPVDGYLLSPIQSRDSKRLPAIIYNRGGRGDFGRIDEMLLAEMRLFVREGFVVAASNYRFIDSLAHLDEWGGVEVNDVLNLIPVLKSRSDVDSRNVFMMGISRGGSMTYLSLKRGAAINAAAVIAGPSDFRKLAEDAAFLVYGDDDYDGWVNIWPEYEKRKHQYFTQRSVVDWAGEVNAPVFIMHARTDDKVPVAHALAAASALQKAGKPYELVIYNQDGHSLPEHRADRVRHIVEFFRRYSVTQ